MGLIRVCIMGIVCLLRRDIVQYVIKIKSSGLSIAENAIDVLLYMIIIAHG